ncbi:MAG: ABC transporter substrate-binding protein [Spirochaetaceae bacterium]|nr:ABC transporter substrate-binding protein [Spirochaetaceae bacterium]
MTACVFLINCKRDENTVRIGGIFPLSGNVAAYGIEARNGILLAIDEINAADGINGRKVELIFEDDEGKPEKSVNAYNKLTTKDKVKIIIGSLTSKCTIAITSKAQAQQVLLVAPAATEEAVTDAGDYIFRACFIDQFQGTVGGIFSANELGGKQAAILYNNDNDYSVGLKDNFITGFQQQGGMIVANESYTTGDVDFNAQITKIKSANPDLIYLPDYYNTVAVIAKQLRAQGINITIVGADGWDGLTKIAGYEVLNGFYSTHYAADSTDTKVQNFVKSYQAKFGTIPISAAALGYDSMYLISDAIAAAGSFDSTDVKNALAALKGRYVTGNLSFDDRHNPVKSAAIMEIVKQGNKFTAVYKTTVDPR